MTCPTCARADRAAILYAAIHGWITDTQFDHLYNLTKEHNMFDTYTLPKNGDVGEEIEEWEVLPTETPAETPAEVPSEPVPA